MGYGKVDGWLAWGAGVEKQLGGWLAGRGVIY